MSIQGVFCLCFFLCQATFHRKERGKKRVGLKMSLFGWIRDRCKSEKGDLGLEMLEGRLLLDSGGEGVLVLNLAAGASVTYVEPDDSLVRVKIKDAALSVTLVGDEIGYELNRDSYEVFSGGGVSVSEISVSDSDDKSSLIFKVKGGDGRADIGSINVDSSLGSLKGSEVNLGGNLSVDGSLSLLELNDITGSQQLIYVGNSDDDSVLKIRLHDVVDLSITSLTPIKSLSLNSWQDTDMVMVMDMIAAAGLGRLVVKEDFAAGLTLAGDIDDFVLGSVRVGGVISSGGWNVLGGVKTISAGSIDDGFSLFAAGELGCLKVAGDCGGSIRVGDAGKIYVSGEYSDADLMVAGGLDYLRVGGSMLNVNLRAGGVIGSVKAESIINSMVFAGIDDSVSGLPASSEEFSDFGLIGRVRFGAMVNSNIAAAKIGKLTLGDVTVDNLGNAFGVTIIEMGKVNFRDGDGRYRLSSVEVAAEYNMTSSGDFVFRMI